MTSAESILTSLSPEGTLMKSILPSRLETDDTPSILYFFPQEVQNIAQKNKNKYNLYMQQSLLEFTWQRYNVSVFRGNKLSKIKLNRGLLQDLLRNGWGWMPSCK